ncbi:MAG TPA: hypothetical protein G4O02_11745 [Caldilineae bacterium]|nr:hypothetical protein [Caldilineae bacterium]
MAMIQDRLERLDSDEPLTTSQVLELTNEIAELGQEAADALEAIGDLAKAVGLLELVSHAFQVAISKLPPQDRELLIPFAEFWVGAVEIKRLALSEAESQQPRVRLEQWQRTLAAKSPTPEEIKAALSERRRIAAIKVLRDRDVVDQTFKKLRPQNVGTVFKKRQGR